MEKRSSGRPTIFGSRVGGKTINGRITRHATVRFEASRAELAKLAGWEVEQVSDADTIEYLERGPSETRKFLRAQKGA